MRVDLFAVGIKFIIFHIRAELLAYNTISQFYFKYSFKHNHKKLCFSSLNLLCEDFIDTV